MTPNVPAAIMQAVMNSRDRRGQGLPPNVHPEKGKTVRSYWQVTRRWQPSSPDGRKPKLIDWLCADPSPLDMTVRQQRRFVTRQVAKGNFTKLKHGQYVYTPHAA